MLTNAERAVVKSDLTSVLLGAPSIPQGVQTIFGVGDAAPILTEIPPGVASHADAADRVLAYCLRDRWRRQPESLLEVMLTNIMGRGINVAELALIRVHVQAKTDPNLDPLTSSWITANRPFFGRVPTRTVVQHLLDSSDMPILLVQGTPSSGKTYTSAWLDYLAGPERLDFRIVVETLEPQSGPTMEPDVLAESLVSKMGQPIDHSFTPAQPRYEQRLCNWLVSKALLAAGRTWIVLDGFDDSDLHEGSKKLIQLLAASVLSGDLNRRVRLVLIDFKSTLAQVDLPRIKCDGLPDPETITAEDLNNCLRQHFDDLKQDVTDEFVQRLASKVVEDAQALRAEPEFSSTPRLKLLNQLVYKLRQEDLRRAGRIA